MMDSSNGNYGKEAILDFQLSWLMRLSTEHKSNKKLDEISRYVVLKLLGKEKENDVKIEKVEVWKQWNHIDIKAEAMIKIDGKTEKHIIVIENKIYHKLGCGQLDKYSQVVRENYSFSKDKIHYWLIYGDENAEAKLEKACQEADPKWILLWFYDVIGGKPVKLIGNPIFDEFWVRHWV